MQQKSQTQQPNRDERSEPLVVRLLHSRRAAWWFGLLAATGLVHFVAIIVILILFLAFATSFQHQHQLSTGQNLAVLMLSIPVALAAAIYIYRTEKNDEPIRPKRRIARKWWRLYACFIAATVAILTALYGWFLLILLLALMVAFARLVSSFSGLPGSAVLDLTPASLVLMLWAFVAWWHVVLVDLAAAQPPELRFTVDLIRYADDFRERARALENAIGQAEVVSRQIQSGIEQEKLRLEELHQAKLQEELLEKLTAQEISAIDAAFANQLARIARRSRWWSVVFGVVGWAAGVVTQGLIDTHALGDQIRQWFNL